MAVIQLRRNVAGAPAALPAAGAEGEPFWAKAGFTALPAHAGGNDLALWDGAAVVPLVSPMRQVELIGAQTITGVKSIVGAGVIAFEGAANITFADGAPGDVLTKGAGDALTWAPIAAVTDLWVDTAGDTMTGPLLLAADPSDPLGAATKQYVDGHLTQAEADPLYINALGDTMNGPLTIECLGGDQNFFLNTTPGAGNKAITGTSAGVKRWTIYVGAGVPDNFAIQRFADDGTSVGNSMAIDRATGDIGLGTGSFAAGCRVLIQADPSVVVSRALRLSNTQSATDGGGVTLEFAQGGGVVRGEIKGIKELGVNAGALVLSTTVASAKSPVLTLGSNKRATFHGDGIGIDVARTPTSATAAGTIGEICWDADFLYVCVADATWKRAALATW